MAAKKKTGRKRTRPEAKFFSEKVWIQLPIPERDSRGNLIGYHWKKTDLIKLLRQIPQGYDPFREADGYLFSSDEANVIIHFIVKECKFPEGKLTGKPFIPEQWQWAIYLNAYCWFEKDKLHERDENGNVARNEDGSLKNPGVRRFNEVLVYIPRKNGKTVGFGAVPSLISLFVDPEKRSQNFCCAADTEQAALNFRHAAYMVEQNPRLLNQLKGGRVKHATKFMEHKNGRTLKVLSSIAETKHGLSPNTVGVDEVHAHPNSDLIDVMATGTAARDSPITWYTTTADYDRQSVCNDLYKRGKAVAKGLQSDPHFLPVIYEALPTDDWESEDTWRKANPNYGVSVNKAYIQKEIQRVRNSPANLNRFLRLHLNVRTAVETTWIYQHVWAATNPEISKRSLLSVEDIRTRMEEFPDWFDITQTEKWKDSYIEILLREHQTYYTWFFRKVDELQESPCFAGFDNASTRDLASLALWFPETSDFLSWSWCPALSIEQRSEEEGLSYDLWFKAGILNNTPQATISEKKIVRAMLGSEGTGILEHFQECRMFAFDRYGSNYIANEVDDYGIDAKGYPQNFAGMNQPCKQTEQSLESLSLFHGGNPLLQWCIGNMMVKEDHDERMRPDKKSSTSKIDPIVAYLMARGAHIYHDIDVIDDIVGVGNSDSDTEEIEIPED